jgi:hypothetical protein
MLRSIIDVLVQLVDLVSAQRLRVPERGLFVGLFRMEIVFDDLDLDLRVGTNEASVDSI